MSVESDAIKGRAAATTLAAAVLASVFTPPPDRPGDRTLEDLAPEFRGWMLFWLACFLVAIVPASLLCGRALSFVAGLAQPGVTSADELRVVPGWDFWAFVSMFTIGLLLAGGSAELLVRLLLKERYPDYRRYEMLYHAIDETPSRKPFLALVGILLAGSLWLGSDWSYRITRDDLVLNPFFGRGEERLRHSGITGISAFRSPERNENRDQRAHVIVSYRDGRTVDLQGSLIFGDRESANAFYRHLSRASGVPIRPVSTRAP